MCCVGCFIALVCHSSSFVIIAAQKKGFGITYMPIPAYHNNDMWFLIIFVSSQELKSLAFSFCIKTLLFFSF